MDTFVISSKDERIQYLRERDKLLSVVVENIGDMVCHIHKDGYSFIIQEIVGQMLSNKASNAISARLSDLCMGTITPKMISSLSVNDLRSIGISKAKSQYIFNFNEAISNGVVDLDSLSDKNDNDVLRELMSVQGIGPWTSKMYLLFVLQREDILPYEDGAFLQAYRWMHDTESCKPEDVIKKCRQWHPYSSIASRYMYRALDSGMTRRPFKAYWGSHLDE